MSQTGYMNPVTVAAVGHRRDAVRIGFIGEIIFTGDGRLPPVDDFNFIFARNNHTLIHVPDNFIRKNQHGKTVIFAEIECADGHVEHLLRACRSKDDNFIMTMRSPARLHHISLPNRCGQSGAGAGPLDIADHTGGFRADSQPDVFHHEREARSRSAGHGFHTAPAGA